VDVYCFYQMKKKYLKCFRFNTDFERVIIKKENWTRSSQQPTSGGSREQTSSDNTLGLLGPG